jgi:hypothetical protein
MADETDLSDSRRPWRSAPDPRVEGWLALSDDELLHSIDRLDPDHSMDETLIRIVRSDRHFFIRQEAAKRIRDARLLMDCAHDRHVGQILVRRLSRIEDVEYLERLATQSHYLDVRKAARAQLAALQLYLGDDCPGAQSTDI